jgi:hypothetical protein
VWRLARAALPLLVAAMSLRRYAALRGPALWLAVIRAVGLRGALPALVLLSLARRLARAHDARRAGGLGADGFPAPSRATPRR